MVEEISSATEAPLQGAEEETKSTPTIFPESVNVPVMASFNLSSILIDPQLGQAYTSKNEVKEQHLYSTGLWGDGGERIRTIDDLRQEMQDAAELDDENTRDDLSDENNNDDDITAAMAKPTSSSAATEGEMQMSVAEMQEIIERQKRQISYLTEQVR